MSVSVDLEHKGMQCTALIFVSVLGLCSCPLSDDVTFLAWNKE